MRVSTASGVVILDGTSAEYLGGGTFCAQAVVMRNGSRLAVAIRLQREGSFTMGTLHLLAHIRGITDLSPQSGPKLTLIRSLSPITDFITQGRRARLLRSVIGFAKSHTLAVGDHH